MVFKNLCILVLLMKVASALEGLRSLCLREDNCQKIKTGPCAFTILRLNRDWPFGGGNGGTRQKPPLSTKSLSTYSHIQAGFINCKCDVCAFQTRAVFMMLLVLLLTHW